MEPQPENALSSAPEPLADGEPENQAGDAPAKEKQGTASLDAQPSAENHAAAAEPTQPTSAGNVAAKQGDAVEIAAAEDSAAVDAAAAAAAVSYTHLTLPTTPYV